MAISSHPSSEIHKAADTLKTRKDFLIESAKAAGLLFSGTALVSIINNCGQNINPFGPMGTGQLVILDLTLAKYSALNIVGGKIALQASDADGIPSRGALIYRKTADEFNVFDRTCTHAACVINPFNSSGISLCHCHGSQFNTDGNVVHGPAFRSLVKYSATLNGSHLEIQF